MAGLRLGHQRQALSPGQQRRGGAADLLGDGPLTTREGRFRRGPDLADGGEGRFAGDP